MTLLLLVGTARAQASAGVQVRHAQAAAPPFRAARTLAIGQFEGDAAGPAAILLRGLLERRLEEVTEALGAGSATRVVRLLAAGEDAAQADVVLRGRVTATRRSLQRADGIAMAPREESNGPEGRGWQEPTVQAELHLVIELEALAPDGARLGAVRGTRDCRGRSSAMSQADWKKMTMDCISSEGASLLTELGLTPVVVVGWPTPLPGPGLKRANALAVEGKLADALAEYERLRRKGPETAALAHDIGLVHEALGATQAAREAQARALELDAACTTCRSALTRLASVDEHRELLLGRSASAAGGPR